MTSVPENSNNSIDAAESVLQLLQAVRSGDASEFVSGDIDPETELSAVLQEISEFPDMPGIPAEEFPQSELVGDISLPENTEDLTCVSPLPEEDPPVAPSAGESGLFGSFDFSIPEDDSRIYKRRRKDHYRIKYKQKYKLGVFQFILLGAALIAFCVTGYIWYADGHANSLKSMIWPDWRPDDYIVPESDPVRENGIRFEFNPTVEITVKFRRQTQTYTLMKGAKAGALVSICGIDMGDEDWCEPDAGTVLSDGDEVTVHRTFYIERTITGITVPYTNEERRTPLLSSGTTRVVSYGRNGEAEQVYIDKYVDDELVSTALLSETVTKEPVSGVIRIGDPTASLSYIDGSKYTDIQIVNGVPEQYERKISSGKCTAYSYNPGVYGGSGMYLFQGCVAVDPNDIPLGSLLYITSSDNNFVWGWAIAADSCEAAMYGINNVTVDCFLETYNDSLLFGAHWLDIYVVKQLHQSELSEYVAHSGMFNLRIPE